jgi:hypothetical protein
MELNPVGRHQSIRASEHQSFGGGTNEIFSHVITRYHVCAVQLKLVQRRTHSWRRSSTRLEDLEEHVRGDVSFREMGATFLWVLARIAWSLRVKGQTDCRDPSDL